MLSPPHSAEVQAAELTLERWLDPSSCLGSDAVSVCDLGDDSGPGTGLRTTLPA